jgi:hypothetical protein
MKINFMKVKKYKYLEDVIDDYILLSDEQIEIPVLIEKAQKKFHQNISSENDVIYTPAQAEYLFKYHSQVRKLEERKNELSEELAEVESLIREFILSLNGGKISYEKKDDTDKSKITFLFWVEDNKVMCNR